MKMLHLKSALLIAVPMLAAATASAHVGYNGRTFTLTGSDPVSVSLNAAVTSNYGWADGTDDDFGDSHVVRPFRISLANPATITLSVQSNVALNAFLPAFSIYSGLAHLPPSPADHDGGTALVTVAYLASLPGVPKEGAFDALDTFYMGNDDVPANLTTGAPAIPGTLSVFTYVGNAADGTFANYGIASGINGDGVADGFVSSSFDLAAGEYTIFVGGANYGGQFPTPNTTSYSFVTTATVTPVPEPVATVGLLMGIGIFCGRRFRKSC